jgi:hypothetical protein
VEHVREVRHERQTRTEVVVGQLVEPARAPAAARRPQVVQPLIREEVRYAPASPGAAPTVKAAAPDRALLVPVVPEPPQAQAATPTVQVRIGRVVVRADPPAPPPPPAPAPPAPRVGLADYLAGREPASP